MQKKWFYPGLAMAEKILSERFTGGQRCEFQIVTKDRVIEQVVGWKKDDPTKTEERVSVQLVKQGSRASIFIFPLTDAFVATRVPDTETETA